MFSHNEVLFIHNSFAMTSQKNEKIDTRAKFGVQF